LPDYIHNVIALTIRIKGLVQGVGFRPFIYRLALQHRLDGWVVNGTDGVTVKVEGIAGHMSQFMEDLRFKAPVASQIDEITIDQDLPEGLNGFYILASQDLTDETSEISPDIAVCSDCLADMNNQDHRLEYPFINCTNCGPRFSIIMDFPYDRAKTTMSAFEMCPVCRNEYSNVADRRFHAQPVACNSCGPVYSLHNQSETVTLLPEILSETYRIISKGGIVALKGTGGFHLMCSAFDETAVMRLREQKKHEGKPFAVMFSDMKSLSEYAFISEAEATSLTSWRRPVVILKAKKKMAHGITLGLDTLGAFLPYMPFHYLIFKRFPLSALVLTSGNMANEPIVTHNDEALSVFADIADAVIDYNRDIYNRTDDSVVRITGDRERVIRRSRGFAPSPVRLPFSVNGILATGAELSNTFCIGKDNRAYLSQHIGDLKNHETYEFFEESIGRYSDLFRIIPSLIATDLHPDYLSTRFAGNSGIERIQVQHHHAHIASCMAENGINEQVIGIAFDGTGYGTDGNIWGSEFMTCDFAKFERHCHFSYMPLPGGDKAAGEPWRMGISLLYQAFGIKFRELDIPFVKTINRKVLDGIVNSIEKKINCPLSSGAGRLFDGVAAITGICLNSVFHAEAPMRLESAIDEGIDEFYPFEIKDVIDFNPALRSICNDLIHGKNQGLISAKFHNTIAEASLQCTLQIRNKTGIGTVALSGGSFQNKYLSELLESKLVKNNFVVITQSKVPCNDGGISLGQLAVAAKKANLEI
jgi:hydrogenase maturation protein HypF